MGLGNNVFTELKNEIVAMDVKESGVVDDDNTKMISECLKQLYEKRDKIEEDFSDIQLAHMISIV